VALLLFDLDRFKSLNDRFGHHVGDMVLQRFATTVDRVLGGQDLFARMGGEEFAVLLRDCDLAQAMRVAQSARTHVEAMGLEINGEAIFTSVSIGCTVILPGDTLDRALGRADRALYRAKSNGRNRVEVELNQDADPVYVGWSPLANTQS
jgi:diguanylate cyclase (GGDEF)-like protein